MANIKLFVCCHQPFPVPKHPLLVPVQVGTALAQKRFEGFFSDDSGENISGKNRSYCELTALFWAWKNVTADYYGLFHYRRFLYPRPDVSLPYRIEGAADESLLEKLDYPRFAALIEQSDFIMPMGEDMRVPVRQHYADAPFHHKKDLELVEDILRQSFPDYIPAMERYFSGSICYFGNICIMKRDVFHHYCSWLFAILEEFDRRADLAGYGPQELRVDGYLAERLLGVYYTHVKMQGGLKTLELPRVHFFPSDSERRKKQLVSFLLPPGSRRRAAVKALTRRSV